MAGLFSDVPQKLKRGSELPHPKTQAQWLEGDFSPVMHPNYQT
jgi:hypothetical protein